MNVKASQSLGNYTVVCSGAHNWKHPNPVSLASCGGNPPVIGGFLHKEPVTRKMSMLWRHHVWLQFYGNVGAAVAMDTLLLLLAIAEFVIAIVSSGVGCGVLCCRNHVSKLTLLFLIHPWLKTQIAQFIGPTWGPRRHLHYSEITACVLYGLIPNFCCFVCFHSQFESGRHLDV